MNRFCGKIGSINFDRASSSATIHFEKPSAVKTAVMLNGGTLDGSHLTVIAEKEHPDHVEVDHERSIEQSDKPRAGSKLFTRTIPYVRD